MIRRSLPTPALDTWYAELRRGERSPATVDPLFHAACAEANAREFSNIPKLRDAYLTEARQILQQAAEAQRRGRTG